MSTNESATAEMRRIQSHKHAALANQRTELSTRCSLLLCRIRRHALQRPHNGFVRRGPQRIYTSKGLTEGTSLFFNGYSLSPTASYFVGQGCQRSVREDGILYRTPRSILSKKWLQCYASSGYFVHRVAQGKTHFVVSSTFVFTESTSMMYASSLATWVAAASRCSTTELRWYHQIFCAPALFFHLTRNLTPSQHRQS